MVKITSGYVKQIFDEKGNCISQEFISGDEVEWTDDHSNPVEGRPYWYHPFLMVQPVIDKKDLRVKDNFYEKKNFHEEI